ncbi:MAG: right-handed parallel beta-helix repeat-containing protein, partial [Candidatus Sumerlaeota bacterium]|nr:right-handed parallel beta-helix repeat-containing protein [Candidatus Sumerlaeota bacterium]
VGAAEAPKADFYVSPKGNDTWSGTLADPAGADGPFATVARAQKAVREAKARDSEPRPYLVLLRGGAYMLPQTLVFTPEDSGAENAVIAYAAYPGETPILSGGRIISGWTQGKGEGELWQAEVPDAKSGQWDFHQLFVNGERRPRARTPNEGYLRTDGPLAGIKNPRNEKMNPQSKIGFTFKDANIKAWDGIEDVNLFVYHSWTASMHWIESVDEANRQVHFTNMSQWPISYWERRQRYVIENAPDALDSPGEWRLDRKTGILKYWPKLGEDMAKVEVVAPVLRQLIQFNGDAANQKFVQFIAFQGLSFQHADWQFPDKKTVVDGQASPTFAGAIQGEGAHHISFDRCEVAHVGEHAIYFHTDCQNNRIARCHLYDLGGGGAYIGQGRLRMNLGDKLTATDHNVVDNCFIHDTGLIFPSSHGVWIGQSSYNQVTHNEIAYIPYCGISVGFQWGYAPTTAHDNIIEFNHIHHIGLGVLSDLGAIYTLGISPGTRLGNNVLHDVTCVLYGGWGIYTD